MPGAGPKTSGAILSASCLLTFLFTQRAPPAGGAFLRMPVIALMNVNATCLLGRLFA